MAKKTNDTTIFASSHPDIVKRTSALSLTFSISMLLVGVAAFALTFQLEDRSSTLSMALMVIGTVLFLIGTFRLFWKSKEIVYLPTNSVAKEFSVFFDLKYLDKLTEIINSGKFLANADLHCENSGNIRMDIILTQDKQFAAVQLFQFVPYNYQAVTSVCYYKEHSASEFSAFLEKSKNAKL